MPGLGEEGLGLVDIELVGLVGEGAEEAEGQEGLVDGELPGEDRPAI
jgi:hypothetical protein